jgi:hypothetical protein
MARWENLSRGYLEEHPEGPDRRFELNSPTDPTPQQIQHWYIALEQDRDDSELGQGLRNEFRALVVLNGWKYWTEQYAVGQEKRNQVTFRKEAKKWQSEHVQTVNGGISESEGRRLCREYEEQFGWGKVVALYERHHLLEPVPPNELGLGKERTWEDFRAEVRTWMIQLEMQVGDGSLERTTPLFDERLVPQFGREVYIPRYLEDYPTAVDQWYLFDTPNESLQACYPDLYPGSQTCDPPLESTVSGQGEGSTTVLEQKEEQPATIESVHPGPDPNHDAWSVPGDGADGGPVRDDGNEDRPTARGTAIPDEGDARTGAPHA